jgi:hypothetical protein
VQDRLAKGCIQILARAGGWRRERFLRGDRVAEGRLWERTPPAELGLTFSSHALGFLVGMTANVLGQKEGKPRWGGPADQPPGDWLLAYLAYGALRDTQLGPVVRGHLPFAANFLCRLAHAEDFAAAGGLEVRPGPWTAGVGACILEALQPELARQVMRTEQAKGQVRDWNELRGIGRGQEAVLTPLLQGLATAGRQDLARFLLEAAAALLTEGVTPAFWVGSLHGSGGRLAERTETYRLALTGLRHLAVLRQWERQARAVGYFDEGYPAAQLWKAEWERWNGELLYSRAKAIIRQLDPMTPSPFPHSPALGERAREEGAGGSSS